MQVHYITLFSAFTAGCLLIMGLLLRLLHVSRQNEWRTFRCSRSYISAACFVLAVVYVSEAITPYGQRELTQIIWYGVSGFQALLFTSTCVSFVAPQRRQRHHIALEHILILTVLIVAMMLHFTHFLSESQKGYIVYGCLLAYIFQLVNDTLYFSRVYRKSIVRLEEIYEDEFTHRLSWVLRIFIIALIVGILAAGVMMFYSMQIAVVFKCCVVATYTSMVIAFMNYQSKALFVVKAQRNEQAHTSESVAGNASDSAEQTALDSCAISSDEMGEKLNSWTEKKGHLQADLSVDEISEQIGVSHAMLTQYFSTVLGTTFRSWRIALRIKEAERIIRETPEIGTSQLMSMCGYNDRSNFHKHFQKQTGVALNDYKKRVLAECAS